MRYLKWTALICLVSATGLGALGCAKAKFGEACSADGDCASGACQYWSSTGHDQICSDTCQYDVDCPTEAFCVSSNWSGARFCAPRACSDDYTYSSLDNDLIFRCVGGQLVACTDLAPQDRPCSLCLCAESEYCDYHTLRCLPKKAAGAACEAPGDCLSEVCENSVCSELVGAACSEHCSVCMGDGAFCTKACYQLSQWKCSEGHVAGLSFTCASPHNSGSYYCLPFCDGGVTCPGTMTCVSLYEPDFPYNDRHVCIDP